MFLLDSRTPSPRFQLAGANGYPEVTHLLADFPYWGFPLSWAISPRALMRFGTASVLPFHRAARLLLRITLHRLSPEKFLRRFAAVVTVSPLSTDSHDSSRGSLLLRRRITSFLGRTRLAIVLNMLLLPRSAPHTPPDPLAQTLLRRVRASLPRYASGASPQRSAPSIFRAPRFGGYGATRFLADAGFHGHRPTVPTALTRSFSVLPQAAYPPARFFPPCRPRLPQSAH